MPYYDTIDEDLDRALSILLEGRVTREPLMLTTLIPAPEDIRKQLLDTASGAIYGKDIYAAYKLLESFVEEIGKLRAGLCDASLMLHHAAEIAERNHVPELFERYTKAGDAAWALAGPKA